MKNKKLIQYIVEQTVRDFLKELDEEMPGKIAPVLSFEEDPVNFILTKYPSLKETLVMLMSKAFKDYITGIYILAPKPTTFKIVLHNGQSFMLTYLGRAYEAKVLARRYYLMTVGDKERAIKAIAGLLELGSPIGTEGPEEATTSTDGTEETTAPETATAEETPPSQEKEEETES